MTDDEKRIKRNQKAKNWRDNNPDKVKRANAARQFTPSRKYSDYKCGASKRNLPFELTLEEFKTFWQADCSYCGDPIATIGLDRVDSSKGYSLDNVVSCCAKCNFMKQEYSEEEWLSQMIKILRHKQLIPTK